MARTSALKSRATIAFLTAVALSFALTTDIAPARAASFCTPEQVRHGTCDLQVDGGVSGGSVVLTGVDSSPGQAPGGNPTSTSGSGGPRVAPILSPAQWCL